MAARGPRGRCRRVRIARMIESVSSICGFIGLISPMPVHVYQYPKCSTCRKALAWLDEHGVEYTQSDLVSDRIALGKLKDLHRRSGLPIARLFNTSGESYRAGGFKDRLRTMTLAESLQALAEDGKLVKRPIVDAGTKVLVGFDAEGFARQFG
jgi:arsenate reductase